MTTQKKLLFMLITLLFSASFAAAQEDTSATGPIEGAIASAKYLCELQGMTRRVEITYETPTSSVPCSVNYYKDSEAPGEVNTLWTAENLEGYCEDKASEFVDKLKSWGWSCLEN